MTLCFPSIWHLTRLFLGCVFSTELCCSEKPAQENTLLTDLSREDSLLYFCLTTFIPYFKSLKWRAIFIKITFFFCSISFSFRLATAACLPWAGKELCVGKDPPPAQIPQNTQHGWRGPSNARVIMGPHQPGTTFGNLC